MLCSSNRTGQHNKRCFFDQLNSTVNKVSAAETLVICGDFSGHVGKVASSYEGVHDSHGYGLRNTEGEHILELLLCTILLLGTHISTRKIII